MYLYYTFYDLLFAQNCSYETSFFKNKPILKFSVPIYREYIYDNFCWKVFDKRNLTWFDWDTYYMRGSRIFFPWGRDDAVCPGGVGVGGVPRLFFFLLFVFDKFISTSPHPAPSCLDPCMFQHILDWACEKKIFPSFYSWVPLVFIKNFFYAKKGISCWVFSCS